MWSSHHPVRRATLPGAAAIQLCPLDPSDVTGYLRDDAGSVAADRWNPVLAEAPVREALDTPLMAGLARAIYNPRPGEQAGDLRDPARAVQRRPPRPGSGRSSSARSLRSCHLLASRGLAPAPLDAGTGPAVAGVPGLLHGANPYGRSRLVAADPRGTGLATARRRRAVYAAVRRRLGLAAWLLHLHPEWRHGFELRELLAGGPLGRQLVPLVSYIQGLVPEHVSHDVRSTADGDHWLLPVALASVP